MLYESDGVIHEDKEFKGLNPCFVGKCSTSLQDANAKGEAAKVLILVLLENALRAILLSGGFLFELGVLILVLLENALRECRQNTRR